MGVDRSSMETVYKKFKAYNQAVEKAAEAESQATVLGAASLAVRQGPSTSYVMSPSVGTWLAKPTQIQVATVQTRSWNFKPSVGSWLMAPPVEEPEERHVVATMPSVAAASLAVRQGPSTTYVMAPSVGTWLAKPTPVQVT